MSMKQTMCEFVHGMTCEEVCEFVGSIVRCRDCRYYENTGNCNYWTCYEPISGGDEFMEVLGEVTPDGFCSWGERRDA